MPMLRISSRLLVGKPECASCANSFDPESLEAMEIHEAKSGVKFDLPNEIFDPFDQQAMAAYTCRSCGAELMTEGTTTAAECPECGDPFDENDIK